MNLKTIIPAIRTTFQPIIWAEDGAVFGYEALSRPTNGMAPAKFFGGLRGESLFSVDNLCREQALERAVALSLQERLFLNIVPSAITNPVYGVEATMRLAQLVGFPLNRIVFEITENEEIADFSAVRSCIAEARRHGVKFAIDDFGAGFNGLTTLIQLRPDIVKFDGCLLKAIQSDLEQQRFLASLAEACRGLGCILLAECVETEFEFAQLKLAEFDLMQGYLFGRPKMNLN